MRKWFGFFLSLFLITVVLLVSDSFNIFSQRGHEKESQIHQGVLLSQNKSEEMKKKEGDTHYIAILKILRERLDDWLKSLNDRIESEDITRLEVRFLEILRSLLEWVREKVNAGIEPMGEKKPGKKGRRGIMQETYQKGILGIG
jgi:hypothetical protein